MIKKILLTFLMVMMCNFANATQCFKLPPKEAATLLSNDTQIQVKIAAAHRYEIQKGQCQGGRISAESFWKLCSMAGIDIKTQNGKAQCYNKVAELIEHNGVYYRACGKDAKMLGTKGACINLFKDIQVQTTQGITLAQEFVRITYKLDGLKCKNDRRPADNTDSIEYTNQDFVQCYLPALDKYFEFEFDDLKESSSEKPKRDFARGVCMIYGKKAEDESDLFGAQKTNVYCIASQSECAVINETAKKFGGYATHKNEIKADSVKRQYPDNGCKVSLGHKLVMLKSELKTAYGINNFTFCKGGNLQFQNTGGLTDTLKTYVANAAHISPSSVRCNSIPDVYRGEGCNSGPGFSTSDDIISCYVGQNQIDFVFDDVNEFSSKYAQGAQQGADCIVAGGTYTGKKCVNMGKEQCELLAKTNLKNCPECKAVKWDGKNCSLPSSATATNIKKGVDITLIVAGAVVGVAVTFATAGEAGVPTLALVLTGVETLGAGIELGAQLKIDAIADDFLSKSNQCKSASCAQSLIKNNFQHLADSQNDFTEVEISAIDSEMARLASLIPVESDFWAEIGLSSLSMSDNQSGLFENWTPEQAWRAVGIALQMASVVTAVGKWVSTKAKTAVTKLSKSSKVLEQKTKDAADYVMDARAQLTPKQAEYRQKLNLRTIDPSTLKGDDVELYVLWKKYAPRNQSFYDFKQMGTLSELQERFKNVASWDDIEKVNLLDGKIEKFYKTHPDAFYDFGVYGPNYARSKYPELADLLDQERKLDMEVPGGIQNVRSQISQGGTSYSTLNYKLMKKDAETGIETVKEELFYKYNEKAARGEMTVNEAIKANIQEEKYADVIYYGNQVSSDLVDEVAALRIEQVDKILNDTPELKNLGARWATLSNEEKLAAAQEISDQLMLRNGVRSGDLPKVINVKKAPGNRGTFVTAMDNNTYKIVDSQTELDLDQLEDFSDFMNVISHEVGGHGVNKLNPNAGALGTQMKPIGSTLKTADAPYEIYRIKPEEQSAWRVGDAVEESLKIQ